MKTFCLDTNVLIHDPRALYAFQENHVIVTEYVLLELDKLKDGTEEKNHNAREAGRLIRELTCGRSTEVISAQTSNDPEKKSKGKIEVEIPGTTGRLILLMDDPENRVKGETRDDQILALLHKHRDEFRVPVILVTKDTLMAIKAIGRGFGHEDYKRDRAKHVFKQLPALEFSLFPDELFNGNAKGTRVPGILEKTYQSGKDEVVITPGYYTINCDGQKEMLLQIRSDETVRLIQSTPNLCRTNMGRGVRAKNTEQNAVVDALLDPGKSLICLTGPAGTGKTLLAIASAVHMVRNANRVSNPEAAQQQGEEPLSRKERKKARHVGEKQDSGNGCLDDKMRILIARPMVAMGKEMGYLPGNVEDKMMPWMSPILDNLKFLIGQEQMEKMLTDGTIELQPLQFIRGRTLTNCILIVDESQNTSPVEIKTIITRAGRGTKVVLTGDPDQIDVPWLDKLSNGLTYAADRMAKKDFVAVVPVVKCERSELAAAAAELL